MTTEAPPRSITRSRPRWLSRKALIVAGAGLGAVLVALAFAGSLPARLAAGRAAPPGAASVEIAARFDGVTPQGQSTGFAVASDGTLAVVDRGRQVVIRLDVIRLDANGERQAEWGPRFGPGLVGQDLVGIAADGDGWWLLASQAWRSSTRVDTRFAFACRTATRGDRGCTCTGRRRAAHARSCRAGCCTRPSLSWLSEIVPGRRCCARPLPELAQ